MPRMERKQDAGAELVEKIRAAEALCQGTTSVLPQSAGYREGALATEASLADEAAQLLTREVRTAPTLVKYAQANEYEMQTRAELTQAATEFLAGSLSPMRHWLIWWSGRKASKSNWPPRCFTPPATTPIARFETWLPGCRKRASAKLSRLDYGIEASTTKPARFPRRSRFAL